MLGRDGKSRCSRLLLLTTFFTMGSSHPFLYVGVIFSYCQRLFNVVQCLFYSRGDSGHHSLSAGCVYHTHWRHIEPSLPVTDHTCSCCYVHCWVHFDSVQLWSFAPTFIRNRGLWFSLLAVFFSIKAILTFQAEFGLSPSPFSLLAKFEKDWHDFFKMLTQFFSRTTWFWAYIYIFRLLIQSLCSNETFSDLYFFIINSFRI